MHNGEGERGGKGDLSVEGAAVSMLSSKAISTLDDKITKHSPRHVGGTSRYHSE